MTSQPHHVMQLDAVYKTGAKVWLCLTCDRQIVTQAHRPYIVLVEGDTCALHTGTSGRVEIGGMEVTPDKYPDDDWVLRND